MNRSLSVRSNKGKDGSSTAAAPKHRFTMASLRGKVQPELSKKLFKLIKSENHVIGSFEAASRERISVASQLSEWGEATGDEAVSEISDKLGVLLSELGEQENSFAENLEEYRGVLKEIRNTESSVQPSRDHKVKVSDELQKLKYKDPQNVKLAQLEQELVRAEAENLVAEAQLTNVTRRKLKEAYDLHFAAVIERAEKQALLARHGRRLLNLLDDTPVVPGDVRPAFEEGLHARQILNDAEDDLREWQPRLDPIPSAGGLQTNAMPIDEQRVSQVAHPTESEYGGTMTSAGGPAQYGAQSVVAGEQPSHSAHPSSGSPTERLASGSTTTVGGVVYASSEAESHSALV